MLQTVQQYEQTFEPLQDTWNQLASSTNAEDPEAYARRRFQRTIYKKLLEAEMPTLEYRLRDKLVRWKVGLQPGEPCPAGPPDVLTERWMGDHALRNLRELTRLMPPRVIAAVWSTLWNRWHTHRRHGERGIHDDHCHLRCPEAPDDVEHYVCCAVAKRAGRNFLSLREEQWCKRAACRVDPKSQSPEDLGRIALLTYATYRAVHTCRYTRPATATEGYHLIPSYLSHGAKGDRRAQALLDSSHYRAPSVPP